METATLLREHVARLESLKARHAQEVQDLEKQLEASYTPREREYALLLKEMQRRHAQEREDFSGRSFPCVMVGDEDHEVDYRDYAAVEMGDRHVRELRRLNAQFADVAPPP